VLDSNGNLFVADGNSLIRKTITTGYAITPDLPDGLTFNSSTGIISGTPNVSLAGAPKFRVYGSNSVGTSTTTFDITIKIPAVAPAITSITPTSAGVNNTITITGTNFTDATGVEIGGVPATYRVISPTTIVALVSTGSTGSNIKITNAYGNGTFSGFTFISAPTIAYTGPQTYKTGTAITPLSVTSSGSTIPNNIYGKTTTIAGGPNLPAANLYQLIGVVADASGNTFAISSTSNVIYKITPAGLVSIFAGSTNSGFTNGIGIAASFYSPKALTIDADGNLYVLEPNNHAIRKVTPQAVVSTYATYLNIYNGAGTTSDIKSFVNPVGIAIDKLGNVFVSDTYFSRISKITSAGVITTVAGTGSTGAADGAGTTATFNSPQGLAVDNLGDVYVADTYNNKIRKITPDGTVSTLAGSGTSGKANGTGTAASFASPPALTVDAAGNVYVADTYNNLIRKITPAGVVTSLAGSSVSGYVDQTGINAYISAPSGIFSDASGNVYIADAGNSAIRKIAANGYTISPALPAGLSLDETGSINGTPTEVSAAKDYTISAYNNAGVGTTIVNIAVSVPTVAPVITAFTQASQNPGSGVTITGNNFIGTTAVTIGGVAAASYNIISPTTITAYASPNAISGSVKVTNPYGDASQAGLTFNTAPQIAYTNTLSFTAGTAITPITPTNSGSAIPAQAYGQFTTIAGTGVSGSANGTGTAASFSSLNGSAVDQAGNIFIADGNIIRKITPAGVVTTFADLTYYNSNSSVSTSQLAGVVIDASGNLFVADKFNSLIRKVTPAGVVSTFAGTGNYYASNDGTGTQASIYQPSGITIDGAGNLYVTESGNYKIRKITPAGLVTTLAGSGTTGSANNTGMAASFNYPNGIVADFYGNLYIADTNNNLVRKMTPSGVVTTLAGSGSYGTGDGTGTSASFSNPYWITIDVSGNLYVSDAAGLSIRKITTAGVVSTIAKLSAPITGTYYSSGSLSVDGAGNLIMADLSNHVVRKFSLTGYSITPVLPAGFKFDSATGAISGTPQYVSTTPLTYTVTGYNSVGSSNTTVSFTVGTPLPPQISYPATQVYTVATRITPVVPTNTGGGVPSIGYGKTTTIAGNSNGYWANGVGLLATFEDPSGIAIDKDDNIYIAQPEDPMIRKITPAGVVSTFAGTGNYDNINGPVASANFEGVTGLGINSKGEMFVADAYSFSGSGSSEIKKIVDGIVSPFVGSSQVRGYADGTGTNALFNGAYQLTIDKSDNIFVTDQMNNMIRKVTPLGVVTTIAGNGTVGAANGTGKNASFNNPDGLVVDGNGNLFIADTKNNLIRKITPDGVVTTLAGSGTAASTDGTGTAASFNYPTSIDITTSGDLYVTDFHSNLIRKVTQTGVVTTVAGNGNAVSADGSGKAESFNGPVCLAVTNDDHSLIVSDYNAGTIRKVELFGYTIDKPLPDGLFLDGATGQIYGIPRVASPATNYTISAINGGGTGSSTISIEVAAALPPNISYPTPQQLLINVPVKIIPTNKGGVIPAAEYGLASTFAGSGTASSADGSPTTAGFSTPAGMVSDKLGNIYVADQANNKIRKITPDGTVSTFAGSGNPYSADGKGNLAGIGSPTGIAIDSRGYLFVTDRYNGKVHLIKPDGTASVIDWLYFDNDHTYTDYPSMPLNNPYGITKDAYGNLYITDQSYHTIRKATYQNGFSAYVLTVFAGTGSYGSVNGTGSAASFNQPAGITSDAAGNVYVADRGNNLIRKITPAGVVTTFAGSGAVGSANGTGTGASFNHPTDITIDASGNLYVVDQGNNMIRMITPDGVVTAFSGNTASGYYNFYGTATQYKNPTGITFDPTGKLYVSDNNNVIRNIITTGFTVKNLPQGISFGGITGTLSDAPTVLSPPTNYTVTAYNYAGSSTATFNFSVVSKLDQKITFPLVTNPTYGDDDVALNATSNGTTIPLIYTTGNTDVATIVNGKLHIKGAGIATVTITQAGDDTHNAATSITQAITINPKAITVSAVALSKTYGDANPVFTYTITNGGLVGTDAFTGNMYKDPGENSGVYNINQGTLALSGNYKLTFTGNKFTINKKSLTITAYDVTWSYGRVTSNLPVQYSGFAFADDVTKLTAQPTVTTAANPAALIPGTYDLVPGNGVADNYTFVYVNGKLTVTLPATNFKISSTSVTCKGSNNGVITITPASPLNYTAVVTGGSFNQTYHFNSTLNISNLAPATYHVCVSADNLPDAQQCSDLIITEPKDLAVYATVNKTVNTVTLALTGSDNYTVKLNGTEYQTSSNSITLPLNKGSNKISVNTDRLCQGTFEQLIDLSGITAPYPNPFQSTLYVNLGEQISTIATISIFNLTDGRQLLSQKFNNMSGVVRLDVANLKTGVYTLNLTLDGKLSTFKIVKQ
jgi:sugar lactone lactonase YvrE